MSGAPERERGAPRTTAELAEVLGALLEGASRPLVGLAPPDRPAADRVVVVAHAGDVEALVGAEVAALVVPSGAPAPEGVALIRVPDTRLALALASALFDRRPAPAQGRHPTAVVDARARLAHDVAVGAATTIGADVEVGPGTVIGPGCTLAAGVRLGAGCLLHAQVALYDGVVLGDRVTLHSGVVIGADGFGYASSARGAVKVHHLGSVILDDDVEVGANSCIDRGTLGATRVGARTKIDNLCQIGHNVVIGSDCLIAGMTGLAGSARLGDGVIIGGNVGVGDHVTVGDGARLAARSGVTKDVPAGETWAGFPAQPYRKFARRQYLLGQLETIWQSVRRGRS